MKLFVLLLALACGAASAQQRFYVVPSSEVCGASGTAVTSSIYVIDMQAGSSRFCRVVGNFNNGGWQIESGSQCGARLRMDGYPGGASSSTVHIPESQTGAPACRGNGGHWIVNQTGGQPTFCIRTAVASPEQMMCSQIPLR